MKILLAGISVRAMAESAVKSGYEVVALDAFGDRDLKKAAETYSLHHDFHTAYSPGALYEAGQNLSFDAVAYTSNLENYPDILARFGNGYRILGNSPEVVTAIRDWKNLFGNLDAAGFPVPETVFTGEVMPNSSGRRRLRKPLSSGGGHGIRYYIPDAESSAGNENVYRIPGFMLQEYITGRPCSVSFVANGKECTVLGISEQLIGMPAFGSQGFRYCGSLLPVPEVLTPGAGNEIIKRICQLAGFLTKKYGLIGLNGIDFILHGDQVYLTEVNPRYSASMELIEIAYELPVFHMHIQSVLSGKLPECDLEAEMKSAKFYGKSYVFAEKDVIVPDTDGWYERGIRDIPETGERIRSGGPVCTVFSFGSSREDVLSEMIRNTREIKEEIYE